MLHMWLQAGLIHSSHSMAHLLFFFEGSMAHFLTRV